MPLTSSVSVERLMAGWPLLALGSILLWGLTLLYQASGIRRRNPKGLPTPPGPRGYPIIGNLLSMPLVKPWEVYNDWCQEYGDLMYFESLGQSFLVLNSLRRTSDLLEKRSSNYSNRAKSVMLNDLIGWTYNFGFMQYGPSWRQHRRMFSKFYHPNVISEYWPIETRETHRLLRRLLDSPEQFEAHVKCYFSSIIMQINYGIEVLDKNNRYVAIHNIILAAFTEAAIPGRFWVEMFPVLKYVPSWCPGAGFKKQAMEWASYTRPHLDEPMDYVVQQINANEPMSCIASKLLQELPPPDDPRYEKELEIAKSVTATAYAAGFDTVFTLVRSFILAMAMHPEAQREAQSNLDALTGGTRLPTFSDIKDLPYIVALSKEVMRWITILPFVLAHATANDDEYEGYFIPKDTIVLPNVWAIQNNPNIHPEPSAFRPERYLKDGKIDPSVLDSRISFGFGRRICPGMDLAEDSFVFLAASILAVFDILPPLDRDGNRVELTFEPKNGPISGPQPFDCIFKPRSVRTEELIRSMAPW